MFQEQKEYRSVVALSTLEKVQVGLFGTVSVSDLGINQGRTPTFNLVPIQLLLPLAEEDSFAPPSTNATWGPACTLLDHKPPSHSLPQQNPSPGPCPSLAWEFIPPGSPGPSFQW